MLYVKRGSQNEVVAVSHKKQDGFEQVSEDAPEVIAYLKFLQADDGLQLLYADLSFIRVIEDVIDLLIQKQIITITDFPTAVIDKLLNRQSIRKQLFGSVGMENFDDEFDT